MKVFGDLMCCMIMMSGVLWLGLLSEAYPMMRGGSWKMTEGPFTRQYDHKYPFVVEEDIPRRPNPIFLMMSEILFPFMPSSFHSYFPTHELSEEMVNDDDEPTCPILESNGTMVYPSSSFIRS